MGRWDEDVTKKNLNNTLEKKILQINNFIMNPPSRILKSIFLILTMPSKLIHHNSKCSKFVQKHIIILSPTEYLVVMSVIIFAMWFLVDLMPSQELRIITYILLYILVLFFSMARSGGEGRRRKNDYPPTDNRNNEIFVRKNFV